MAIMDVTQLYELISKSRTKRIEYNVQAKCTKKARNNRLSRENREEKHTTKRSKTRSTIFIESDAGEQKKNSN